MTPEQLTEEALKQDRILYGNAFWCEENGQKARIPPQDVAVNRRGKAVSYRVADGAVKD